MNNYLSVKLKSNWNVIIVSNFLASLAYYNQKIDNLTLETKYFRILQFSSRLFHLAEFLAGNIGCWDIRGNSSGKNWKGKLWDATHSDYGRKQHRSTSETHHGRKIQLEAVEGGQYFFLETGADLGRGCRGADPNLPLPVVHPCKEKSCIRPRK